MIDNSTIQKQCETHERFLKELVRGNYAYLRGYLPGELSFSIARRWNSWYPSYFDVAGGCYVLIPADLDPDNGNNKDDSRIGVVVIDPGFKFIDILRTNYQIEPQDISTVIVTHFHPDHMAGLLEYAMIMNTSKQPGNLYLNETTFATFRTLESAFVTVNELHDGQIQEIMSYVTRDKRYVRVTIKAIGVHHNELGNKHRSLGLILETTRAESKAFDPNSSKRYRIGILGDTDGNEEYISDYVDNFYKVNILVLHLGTFSDAKLGRGGKHLYVEGVSSVLRRMQEKVKEARENKKIVVLSEFGLELADEGSLYRKLQPFIESHFWRLPLIFAEIYLKEQQGDSVKKCVSDNKREASFFARATLAILDRIYETLEGIERISQQMLTRKEKDELLVAFGFQVLALENGDFQRTVSELQSELDKLIRKQKEDGILDGLPLKDYLDFLEKNLHNNPNIRPLQEFFKELVQKASFNRGSLSFEHLVKSCEFLLEEISHNLEDVLSVLFYLDKLDYISKYAESRGLTEKKYRWAFGKGEGIKDLNFFWTACLIGIFLLRKALQAVSATAAKAGSSTKFKSTEEYLLLQIGDFFRKDAEVWANLLIGDIGCTFGIDPFETSDSKERREGIWLKSAQGEWISPYDAECFYDKDNERISYRPPDD